jgi:hypothetical protein
MTGDTANKEAATSDAGGRTFHLADLDGARTESTRGQLPKAAGRGALRRRQWSVSYAMLICLMKC